MRPLVTSSGGMNLGFPDVCPTQVGPVPVPLPYPNMAQHAAALNTTKTIFVNALPAHTLGTQIPMSNGDQAAIPGHTMGPSTYVVGSPKVFFEGQPVECLGDQTSHNGMNAVGTALSAPCNVFGP